MGRGNGKWGRGPWSLGWAVVVLDKGSWAGFEVIWLDSQVVFVIVEGMFLVGFREFQFIIDVGAEK